MANKAGLIFISCGQRTADEIKLGNDVCDLVRDLTPHEPYFAEQQSSLESFTKFILGNLDRAVALIAILHPRGTVTYAGDEANPRTRASVWIEQELAIAAYIKQILAVPITVKVYVKSGIEREGMRDQLPLNPTEFGEESEVLKDLRNVLPGWRSIPASIKVTESPKVPVRLIKGIPSDFILKFTNRTEEIAYIREINFFWQGKRFMESWVPVNPHDWIVPVSSSRGVQKVLHGENPAARLGAWNSHIGLFFQTDIEIVFECEVLNQVKPVSETLRVWVAVASNSIKQL